MDMRLMDRPFPVDGSKTEQDQFWADFERFLGKLGQECVDYFNTDWIHVFDENITTAVAFWKSTEVKLLLPCLSRLALILLSIRIHSAANERLFSIMDAMKNKQRTRMLTEKMEMLMTCKLACIMDRECNHRKVHPSNRTSTDHFLSLAEYLVEDHSRFGHDFGVSAFAFHHPTVVAAAGVASGAANASVPRSTATAAADTTSNKFNGGGNEHALSSPHSSLIAAAAADTSSEEAILKELEGMVNELDDPEFLHDYSSNSNQGDLVYTGFAMINQIMQQHHQNEEVRSDDQATNDDDLNAVIGTSEERVLREELAAENDHATQPQRQDCSRSEDDSTAMDVVDDSLDVNLQVEEGEGGDNEEDLMQEIIESNNQIDKFVLGDDDDFECDDNEQHFSSRVSSDRRSGGNNKSAKKSTPAKSKNSFSFSAPLQVSQQELRRSTRERKVKKDDSFLYDNDARFERGLAVLEKEMAAEAAVRAIEEQDQQQTSASSAKGSSASNASRAPASTQKAHSTTATSQFGMAIFYDVAKYDQVYKNQHLKAMAKKNGGGVLKNTHNKSSNKGSSTAPASEVNVSKSVLLAANGDEAAKSLLKAQVNRIVKKQSPPKSTEATDK